MNIPILLCSEYIACKSAVCGHSKPHTTARLCHNDGSILNNIRELGYKTVPSTDNCAKESFKCPDVNKMVKCQVIVTLYNIEKTILENTTITSKDAIRSLSSTYEDPNIIFKMKTYATHR